MVRNNYSYDPFYFTLAFLLTFMGVSACIPALARLTRPTFPFRPGLFFINADDSAEEGESTLLRGRLASLVAPFSVLAGLLPNFWLKGRALRGFAGGLGIGDFGVSGAIGFVASMALECSCSFLDTRSLSINAHLYSLVHLE